MEMEMAWKIEIEIEMKIALCGILGHQPRRGRCPTYAFYLCSFRLFQTLLKKIKSPLKEIKRCQPLK